MQYILNLNAMALVRLLGAASTEETRYYLNGVHVRLRRGTPGAVLEATNGNILALECDPQGEVNAVGGPSSFIVARWTINAIKKAIKAQAKSWNMKPDELRVLITAAGFQFKCSTSKGASAVYSVAPETSCFIEGSFPETERVIPILDDEAEGTKDAYNANNIALLAMTAPSECSFYKIYSSGIGNPAIVRFSGAHYWVGVIMPCRVDADSTGVNPNWFTRTTIQTAANQAA